MTTFDGEVYTVGERVASAFRSRDIPGNQLLQVGTGTEIRKSAISKISPVKIDPLVVKSHKKKQYYDDLARPVSEEYKKKWSRNWEKLRAEKPHLFRKNHES